MKKMSFVIGQLLLLVSCASYEHVRPGADGVHHVLIRGTEKNSVEKLAIDEARDFCGERKLSPAFVTEETKYTGSMDESTHKTIGKISKVATASGGMLGVFGGNKERKVGEGVFGAGVVGGILQDDEAYTADMKFKCI